MPDAADVVGFLVNLARVTREGRVAWTRRSELILAAELGDGYSAGLELIPDGFEDARSEGRLPDHVVSLSHRGTVVSRVDRRNVDPDELDLSAPAEN
jgi:hypothetical protein